MKASSPRTCHLLGTTVHTTSWGCLDPEDQGLWLLGRGALLDPPSAEGGERWELEADPRHVESLVSQMGLSNESKAVSAPGVRTTDEEDGA